jgi:hypothetical protein
MIDIVKWAESRYGFYVDRHYDGGRWILEACPIRLADYHHRILAHCFTPDKAGRLPYDVVAWCEPAKSGKSSLAALVAEFIALHGDPNSQVVLASNKQNQAASLMFKSLTDSIELNPYLPNVEPNRYEVEFRNGTVVRAIPSNSRGEAGARFSLAVFDELWAYIYTDSFRLWSEFKTDPTRLNSVKFAVGYGGYAGESDLWHDVLQYGLAGDPVPELADMDDGRGEPACWANGRHFTFWSHICRQPWQTDEWIASQRASLRPAEFGRMIQTDFVEGEGDFVPLDAWEALIDPDHRPLEPGDDGPAVCVGLDVATAAGGDDCACIGVYHEGGKVKLAFHRVWKGQQRREQLKLKESVYPYLLRIQDGYNLTGVWFDPFQSLSLAEDLRKAGIRCVEVPQTHATRGVKDTTLYQMIANSELVLYAHPELRTAVSGAHAKELGNGLLFLQKATGRSRIDLLIALSNVADVARKRPRKRKFIQVGETKGANDDRNFDYPIGRRPPTVSAWERFWKGYR